MDESIKHKSNNILQYGIFFIISFLMMLLFSESSPLYWFNNFADTQIYFTIGRGMMHGILPYKGLLDQKGPMTFFIYGLASLIQIKNCMYLGVYLFESISLFISLILTNKIIYLISKNKLISFILSLVYPVLLVVRNAFVTGGAAEEFALPFLLGLIYFALKLIKNNYTYNNLGFFIQGILMGCVFWMKYTLIGAWLGFALVLLIILIFKHRWQDIFKYILLAFLGFVVASLPWIIYFAINNGLKSLFIGYFYFNIVVYPKKVSILRKILYATFFTFYSYHKNIIAYLFIVVGAYLAVLSNKITEKWSGKLMLLTMMFCNGFLVYCGYIFGKNYQLILLPFSVITLAALGKILATHKIKINNITAMIAILLVFILGFCFNFNFKFSKVCGAKEPIQYKFVNTMKQISHSNKPKFLEYDSMDYGFYNVANEFPPTKYFNKMVNSSGFTAIMKSQNNIIRNKKVEFVICKTDNNVPLKKNHQLLLKNYYVIKENKYYDEYIPGPGGTFYLLEKRD